MTTLIFDGVEYKKENGNVYYKKKLMGKYKEKNGDKIDFISNDEINFHYRLMYNTSGVIIKGRSLLNVCEDIIIQPPILSFIRNKGTPAGHAFKF